MVVDQLAARDRPGVKGRLARRGRVPRLGRSIHLFVVGVFFELDVDVDVELLIAFDAFGHAKSLPLGRRHETRERDETVGTAGYDRISSVKGSSPSPSGLTVGPLGAPEASTSSGSTKAAVPS